MAKKYWYIKERHNPQNGVSFTPLGNISKSEAKKHEKTIYGQNIIHKYESLEVYQTEISRLIANKEKVH